MAIVGWYFVSSILQHAGWPRKQGLFRRKVFDTRVADAGIRQMLEWGALLAAGRPQLALGVVAEILRDHDWYGPNPPRIDIFVEDARPNWDRLPDASPCDVVPPLALQPTHGAFIGVEAFSDKRLIAALEKDLLTSLLWGLGNPHKVIAWRERASRSQDERAPLYRMAGLDIAPNPSVEHWFVLAEEMLRAYELATRRPLVTPHPALLRDARASGFNV